MKILVLSIIFLVGAELCLCYEPSIVNYSYANRCTVARRLDWHLYIQVLVPIRNMSHPFSKVKVELAVQRSISNHILPWYRGTVSVTFVEADCDSNDAALDAYFSATQMKMADVFIGPVCNILKEFAQFAYMWNLPVFAPGGTLIDNPDEPEIQPHNRALAYDTITLLSNFHFEEVSRFIFSLFEEYNWRKFLYLNDEDGFKWLEPHYCSSLFAALNSKASHWGNASQHIDLVPHTLSTNRDVFDLYRDRYAIIVICAEPHQVREFLMAAQAEGMMTGEYVYLVFDLHSSEQRIHQPWLVANDADNDRAKSAYEHVVLIGTLQNASNTYHQLMDATVEHVTNVSGSRPSEIEIDQMWQFVGSFYDAVSLFATAYKSWYLEQPDVTKRTMRPPSMRPHQAFGTGYGRDLTRLLRGRTLDGISGPVRIDSNGHKVTEYRALTLEPNSDRFVTVVQYTADCANRSRSSHVQLELIPGRYFFWGSGPSPNDTPRCGLDRSHCLDSTHVPEWAIIVAAIGGGVVLIAIGSYFYYQNRKNAVKMGAISWRVQWSDLELVQPSKLLSPVACVSVLSVHGLWADPNSPEFAAHAHSECHPRRLSAFTPPNPSQVAAQPPRRLSSVVTPNLMEPVPAPLPTPAPPPVSSGSEQKRRTSEKGKSKTTDAKMATDASDGFGHKSKCRRPRTALYKGTLVYLRPLPECDTNLSIEIVREIRALKETTHFEHLCQLIGVCTTAPNWCIVTEYCSRGSLHDILDNHSFVMDVTLKFSLINDLVRALEYLHARYGPHGRVTTSNCLIDARFALKVTDFGLVSLKRGANLRQLGSRALSFVRHSDSTRHLSAAAVMEANSHSLNDRVVRDLLYRSPELLRASKYAEIRLSTPSTDSYSFAVIAHEVFYRKGTFWNKHYSGRYDEIVQRVINCESPPYRPTLDLDSLDKEVHDTEMSSELVRLIGSCWLEDPNNRPTMAFVGASLRNLHRGASNLLDNLLSRMELYTNNLESLVEVRTRDYLVEKQKVEQTLFTLLPRSIASQLVAGHQVAAEAYDWVSIYFSDIAGFTAMCSQSTAIQVVNFLNDLYVTFDTIIGNFDAYKVETIGDAYMVVSGLPERNGNLHAREIARVALSLLRNVGVFRIAHCPNESLRVRIGIHAGPVCAGVVGVKMPRYCLFGDTVNVAKLMESTGQAMRIQASNDIKVILDSFGTFEFEYRGAVQGHNGAVVSWWLLDEREPAVNSAPIEHRQDTPPVVETEVLIEEVQS